MERVICARCPKCGASDSMAVAPVKNIAFRKDRQCNRCDTFYSPPTPVWGAALFIVIGAVFVVGCSLSIVLAVAYRSPAGLPLNFGFAVLGAMCVWQGVASLREKVVEPPPEVETAKAIHRESDVPWGVIVASSIALVVSLTALAAFCIQNAKQAELERLALEAKHRAAIRALKQIGGQVKGQTGEEATAIALRRADSFTRMSEGQQVGNREFANDDLKVIALFPYLERLWIASPEITDAGLKQVAPQPSLVSLSVECPLVTEEGLIFIGSMRRLEYLDLSGTAVSNLSALNLDQKSQLTKLNLCGTAVDDAAAISLATAKTLTELDLSQTAIGDGTLLKLSELPLLEDLRLDNTQVTDEGIQILRQLPQLKFLSVDETPVTAEGCAELKKLLPKCQIVQKWLPGPGGLLIAPQR